MAAKFSPPEEVSPMSFSLHFVPAQQQGFGSVREGKELESKLRAAVLFEAEIVVIKVLLGNYSSSSTTFIGWCWASDRVGRLDCLSQDVVGRVLLRRSLPPEL